MGKFGDGILLRPVFSFLTIDLVGRNWLLRRWCGAPRLEPVLRRVQERQRRVRL